jgi:hypothetical protein
MAYLQGDVLSCHCSSRWWLSGEGKLPEQRYLMERLSSLVPVLLNITHGKSFLPSGACPLAESWCHLGVFPWYSDVKQWWDGFYIRVRIVRCPWVPTVTSRHASLLRPTLPEAWSGRCLSTCGSPRARLTGGPGSCLGSMREVVKEDMWWNPARPRLIVEWRINGVDCS